jgi:hypothetical protein
MTAKALPVIETMIVITIQAEVFCTAILPLPYQFPALCLGSSCSLPGWFQKCAIGGFVWLGGEHLG